ncbi:MAG: hypothetical protein AB1480_04940 [Nitrospirota bacterium]
MNTELIESFERRFLILQEISGIIVKVLEEVLEEPIAFGGPK